MKKGFSLIVLVVTIIVMIIIVSAILISSDELSDETKAIIILDEMKLVQSKIYEYQLNYEDDPIQYPYIGTIVAEGQYVNYYEITKEQFESMDIINIDNTYLVDYTTQDIVYKDGITINGSKYYTIDEIDEKVNVLRK